MRSMAYLAGLFASLGGLVLIDCRYRLVLWRDARTAVRIIAGSLVFFVIWDILGIQLDIFHSGHSAYMTGWYLLPDLPVEEIFFLTLLLYLPLVASSWLEERRHV
jgi:lycopene cyclase domain-containing protein